MDFRNKKIGVLGLGEENIALIKYLVKQGINDLTICDRKPAGELEKYLGQINKVDYKQSLNPPNWMNKAQKSVFPVENQWPKDIPKIPEHS